MLTGILPSTVCKLMFSMRAGSKYYLQKGFRMCKPFKIIFFKDWFLVKEFTRLIKLPSSEISLFLDMSSDSIPLFSAIALPNSPKP
jgi:hypothetical protein